MVIFVGMNYGSSLTTRDRERGFLWLLTGWTVEVGVLSEWCRRCYLESNSPSGEIWVNLRDMCSSRKFHESLGFVVSRLRLSPPFPIDFYLTYKIGESPRNLCRSNDELQRSPWTDFPSGVEDSLIYSLVFF